MESEKKSYGSLRGKAQIVLILIFALFLRWCVTYHPHSGQDKPPMFGDYEAQRHWQEITVNLPIEKWYINSTDNDLEYWGLDYPPLTAYHSYLLGHIANALNSSYIKLHTSRGLSSPDHKYFMRLTVLVADALIYLPAITCFFMNLQIIKSTQVEHHNFLGIGKKDFILLSALIYPGLILIDHGHFQYNCISLGLFIGAVTALFNDSLVIASLLYVLALNYKQMELYHALPFFFYILGRCIPSKTRWKSSLHTLLSVSLTIIVTFLIIWTPFLKDHNIFLNVVLRLFPFSRGVFEDKVANVWCAVNIFYKLKNTFTNQELAQICLITTTIAVLPSCINLYLTPKKEKFILALINSSLAFFLFSYQVHEKSILLVAVPVLLHFHNDPLFCFWFLLISQFSMLPLYIKDNLYLAYVATTIFYYVSITWIWSDMLDYSKNSSQDKVKLHKGSGNHVKRSKAKHNCIKLSIFSKIRAIQQYSWVKYLKNFLKDHWNLLIITAFYASALNMLILSICSGFIKPPKKYPDLFPLLVSVYSCIHFVIFFLYFNYKQLVISDKTFLSKLKL